MPSSWGNDRRSTDWGGGAIVVISQEIARADHLSVRYRGQEVWGDANFSIQRGEFVAVIGPNGAGKTTLFRLLLGLVRPTDGTLRVFAATPRRGNPKIGYVPQTHLVDRDTNVEAAQLVRLGLACSRPWFRRRHGRAPASWAAATRWQRWFRPRWRWVPNLHRGMYREERDGTGRALRSVAATELSKKALGVMSGGELQRIFLAEALAAKPELLLLDEPLANLDIRRATELVELVHSLVKTRGVATLLVAHDINPLIRCLDKVIYIANGRVATGTPTEVLTTERLTELYGVPVEVLHDSRGNLVIVGGEDAHMDPNA
jgi:zinc/manganese transport system ATP-binding protein